FHPPEFLHIRVSAGAFVGKDGLDLPLAQQPAFGVDLLGRQQMPFPAGFAQAICGASQERDVTGLVRRIRNLAFGRLDSRFDQFRPGDQAATGKAAPADRDAKRAEKFTPIDRGWFVHVFLLKLLYVWMAKRISPPIASFYHARSSRATWPCQIAASGGATERRADREGGPPGGPGGGATPRPAPPGPPPPPPRPRAAGWRAGATGR